MVGQLKGRKLLLVEGRTDELLFEALISHIRVSDIQIVNIEGKSNLRARLRAIVSSPDFGDVASLGIVRDADSDSQRAFQSVCAAIQSAGLAVPSASLQPAGSSPQVIALVVPPGREAGAIEDVCLESVYDDSAMSCVDDFFACVRSNVAYQIQDFSKARVQAFLASRERPGLLLGQAANAGYWNWNHLSFDPLKQFLQML